jgi:hypothetical protein
VGRELLLASPGRPPQVVVFESGEEDLRRIQPRGVGGRATGPPPTTTSGEVSLGVTGRVAGSSVRDEEHAPERPVVLAEPFQLRPVVLTVVGLPEGPFPQPAVGHQEHQHLYGPVPGVVAFLLFHGTGNRPPDRIPFPHLEGRHLVDAYHPDALFGQASRMGIAPKDLLRPRLELAVGGCRLPVPSAVGWAVHIRQAGTHGPGAEGGDDPIGHGLAGQIVAGPVRDGEPVGHGLPTGPFDDLGPLHGADAQVTPGVAGPVIGEQPGEPQVPVALTGPPDAGFVALPLSGKGFSSLPGSNPQDHAGTSDWIPGRCVAVSDPLQLRGIRRADRSHLGLASTPGSTSRVETGQASA